MKLILGFLAVLTLSVYAEGLMVGVPVGSAIVTPAPANTTKLDVVGLSTEQKAVAVLEPAAPPEWAQELIAAAEKLPVVGPIVSKVLVWVGILAGITTTLVGTLLGIINTLMGVANLSGLASAAAALANFRDGKIMYWLKFFSLFNAKKPEPTVNS